MSLSQLSHVNSNDTFSRPVKRIHDGADVQHFLHSLAYRDIVTFVLQLNRSMIPRQDTNGKISAVDSSSIPPELRQPQVQAIQELLSKLDGLLTQAPPADGPRRFGNVAFRTWYTLVEEQSEQLLSKLLPPRLHPATIEIRAYLLGSFGSPQRLDYGTGHELSFLAWLAALWKLGFFHQNESSEAGIDDDAVLRQIVLCVFQPYLVLVRKLIITYNLEPAGSHGVWGLDDNSFLPYIWGSAQYCPPISSELSETPAPTPTSGSLSTAPSPALVTNTAEVARLAPTNLYFEAIHFIHTVKRGPFWEHSPVLFDISGIKDGWGKINKGMIKMYDAEVLGKFPVVQHFVFGNLLSWEIDPLATLRVQSTHQRSQPLRSADGGATGGGKVAGGRSGPVTTAPWATPSISSTTAPKGFVNGVTQAPWASTTRAPPPQPGGRTFPRDARQPVANTTKPILSSATTESEDTKTIP